MYTLREQHPAVVVGAEAGRETSESPSALVELQRQLLEHLAWERFAADFLAEHRANYQLAQHLDAQADRKSTYYVNLVNRAGARQQATWQQAFQRRKEHAVQLLEGEAISLRGKQRFLRQLGGCPGSC